MNGEPDDEPRPDDAPTASSLTHDDIPPGALEELDLAARRLWQELRERPDAGGLEDR